MHKTLTTTITKIISGGQTGADRGGLEAAEFLGIATGGTAPFGYTTVEGRCPELGIRFHLTQLDRGDSLAMQYIQRSMMNIDAADATIAFRFYVSPGTDKSIGYCLTGKWQNVKVVRGMPYRPVIVISSFDDEALKKLRGFLETFKPTIVNVCGHREYHEDGNLFSREVRDFLIRVLTAD